jgi:hypothetical protein
MKTQILMAKNFLNSKYMSNQEKQVILILVSLWFFYFFIFENLDLVSFTIIKITLFGGILILQAEALILF